YDSTKSQPVQRPPDSMPGRTSQYADLSSQFYGGGTQGFADGTSNVAPQQDPNERLRQIIHQVAMQHGGKPPDAAAQGMQGMQGAGGQAPPNGPQMGPQQPAGGGLPQQGGQQSFSSNPAAAQPDSPYADFAKVNKMPAPPSWADARAEAQQ